MLFYEDYRYYDEYTIDYAMNFVQETQNSYNSFIDYCIEQEQICLQETGKEEYITEGAIKDIFRRVIDLITGLIRKFREALGRLFNKLPKPITTKPSGNNSSNNNNANSTTRSLPAGSNGNSTTKALSAGSNSNTKSLPADSSAKSLPPAKPKTYHITFCNVEKYLGAPLFNSSKYLKHYGMDKFKELKDFENLEKNDCFITGFMDEGFDFASLSHVSLIHYGYFNSVPFSDVNTIDKFKEYLNREVFNEDEYKDDLTMEEAIYWNKNYYKPYMERISREMRGTKTTEEFKSTLESMQKKFSNVTKENYDGDNYELAIKNLTKYITTLGQLCTIICSYQTTMATMYVQYVSKKINQMNHIINND